MNDNLEEQLYYKRVIDNRNISMTDTLKYLLKKEEYKTLDVAVGYFYISGLLLLKDEFIDFMDNRNGQFRILMGNETNGTTVNVLDKKENSSFNNYAQYIQKQASNDTSKVSDKEFLGKVSEWISQGKMRVKVYTGDADYFHAKSYLFASTADSKSGTAIVGSSNLSKAGLEGNTELNVLTQDGFFALHEWYNKLWFSEDEVSDFSSDLIKIVKNSGAKSSIQEYKPVRETYYNFASLYGQPYTKLDENQDWVKSLFPHQRSGIVKIKEKLDSFGTAVLSDGVGLGKTRTAAGVIRLYLSSEAVNNILIVADTKLQNQWNEELKALGIEANQYAFISRQKLTNMSIHDLTKIEYTLIIIDEAHLGFKNNNTEAYRKVAAIKLAHPSTKGFLITATPWNNQRQDVLNIGSLFLNVDAIPNDRKYKQYYLLSPHKITNKVINRLSEDDEAFQEFWNDIYLQRTRKTYGGKGAYFPHRNFPSIDIPYEPRKNKIFSENFEIISELKFPYQDPIKYIDDSKEQLGAKQLKMMLLKRADSSWVAFSKSLQSIEDKLNKLMKVYLEPMQYLKGKAKLRRLQELLQAYYDITQYEYKNDLGPLSEFNQDMEIQEDDNTSLRSKIRKQKYIEKLNSEIDGISVKQAEVVISQMTADCNSDIETLQVLIDNLKLAYSSIDEKVDKIIECIDKENQKGHKIILISQFADTVDYYYDLLYKHYNSKDVTLPMGKITGGNPDQGSVKLNLENSTKRSVLEHFSPRSKNQVQLIEDHSEINLVVATDTISTGQNLQDAVTLMNIDLPYNPMTLEQRIGRIDRPLPVGEHDKQIFIYTFPIYQSINSQLKMMTRLSEKMAGALTDTEFDNVVLPEYEDYLKDIKNKKANALQNMIDKTDENLLNASGVDNEKHSAAFQAANERMYNFKTNSFKTMESPIIPTYSFSNGHQDSIVVLQISYKDTNDSTLEKENVIVNVSKQDVSQIVEAESNLNQAIGYDIKNTRVLDKNKALLIVNDLSDVFQKVVSKRIVQYNEQRNFVKENTKSLTTKDSKEAASRLMESARKNQEMVVSKLESVNVPPKMLKPICNFISTIDPEDDLFEMVKEIKNSPDVFWLNIKDYIKFFNPETISEAEKIGKEIKKVDTRKAVGENTTYKVLLGNISI